MKKTGQLPPSADKQAGRLVIRMQFYRFIAMHVAAGAGVRRLSCLDSPADLGEA